jgi:polysaccharide deacetylase family protein (PEP-CTERM system associated)
MNSISPSTSPQSTHCADLLTVALEDYFQVGAFKHVIRAGHWDRFENRLERNTRTTLELLERFDLHATFFVCGWIAEHFPELVRLVASRGHEIASKGYHYRALRDMSPEEFRDDLARARAALESACGHRIWGFRTSHRWMSPKDLWALDVLAEEGYAYDSSISPTWRRFAGQPWRRLPHQHRFHDAKLWEFPLSSVSCLGWSLPVAGGNYFRQLPHFFVKQAVAHWHRAHPEPFVLYFRVWELDPEQPRISATSLLTRLRHYRNLGTMSRVLEHYFTTYRFTRIADHLQLDVRPAPTSESPPLPASVVLPVRPSPTSIPVSVVVPCYNEEDTLRYLVNTLHSTQAAVANAYNLHFLFIDDGSKDGTHEALLRLFGDWPNARILRHDRNRGVAAAILTGIREARTEMVCSMDCDCSYDPHELGNMIPLLTPGVDLVTASPYHALGRVRNVPGWRLGLSRVASFLYRRVLRQKLATYTSCFRVYRRSAFQDVTIKEQGYLGVAEMLAELDFRGSIIKEYPATLEVRVFGQSKMKTIRTIGGHLRLLGRLVVRRLAGLLGFGSQSPAPTVPTPQEPVAQAKTSPYTKASI